MPPLLDLLDAALHLPGARFTVYRQRMLFSIPTGPTAGRPDGPGLEKVGHMGYVSWRIGPRDGANCYLDPAFASAALFAAADFDCLSGRTNLVLWFLADEPVGNPAQADGYFSVTLEDPYHPDGRPDRTRIGAMRALYERFRGRPGIRADPSFLAETKRLLAPAATTVTP